MKTDYFNDVRCAYNSIKSQSRQRTAEKEVPPMNESKGTSKVLKLVLAALMAALVAVFSQLQIQIPAIVGVTRFHLGNVMCALSGLLLGPWWGGLAAGVGSALFDLFNPIYISDVPITFITKGLYGLISGLVYFKAFKGRSNYGTEVVSSLCGAVTYAVLYLAKKFFLDGLLVGGMETSAAWLVVIEKIPSTAFNGVVAVIFAPILCVAIRKGLKAAKLERILQ